MLYYEEHWCAHGPIRHAGIGCIYKLRNNGGCTIDTTSSVNCVNDVFEDILDRTLFGSKTEIKP